MSLRIKTARAGSQGAGMPGMAQGDPGLFGGIWGAVKGAAGSVIRGGNPVSGAIGGAVSGWRGSSTRPSAPPGGIPGLRTGPSSNFALPFRQTGGGAQAPAGVGGSRYGVPQDTSRVGGCPPGKRPNKTGYYRRVNGQVTYIPPGHRCVKIRRRNSMNPKALDRAIGRVNGAKGIQSKLSEISTGKYTASGKKRS